MSTCEGHGYAIDLEIKIHIASITYPISLILHAHLLRIHNLQSI